MLDVLADLIVLDSLLVCLIDILANLLADLHVLDPLFELDGISGSTRTPALSQSPTSPISGAEWPSTTSITSLCTTTSSIRCVLREFYLVTLSLGAPGDPCYLLTRKLVILP